MRHVVLQCFAHDWPLLLAQMLCWETHLIVRIVILQEIGALLSPTLFREERPLFQQSTNRERSAAVPSSSKTLCSGTRCQAFIEGSESEGLGTTSKLFASHRKDLRLRTFSTSFRTWVQQRVWPSTDTLRSDVLCPMHGCLGYQPYFEMSHIRECAG
jgi:hypothetical protein